MTPLLLSLVLATLPSAAPVGFKPVDLYALRTLSALEASPDGRTLVFGIEEVDRAADAYAHSLFAMSSEGGTPRRIGRSGSDDTEPSFSPDGKGARAVTSVGEGVLHFDWAPDGRSLVFVRTDPPSAGSEGKPWVITRKLIQRDGEGFLNERRNHLWLVPAEGGTPRQVTRGAYDDSEPRFSPDGRWIAFVSNRTEDPDTNENTDIFVVRPDGSGLRPVAATPGPDDWPAWSHAGDRIAFRGAYRANDWFQTRPLMVAAVADGKVLDLSGALDTWMAHDVVSGYESSRALWSPDDRVLYKTFERRGAIYLAAIPSDGPGGAREVLGGARATDLVRLTRSGDRLFFALTDATHLHEIHVLDLKAGGEPRRLTRLGDAFLAARKLSVPEKVVAHNGGGQEVEGFLYPPLDRDPSRRYPLVLYVHGGPDGYDGHFFDAGLENQVLPAELVVYPGEDHGLSKPSNLVDRLERLLAWFGKHLGGPSSS